MPPLELPVAPFIVLSLAIIIELFILVLVLKSKFFPIIVEPAAPEAPTILEPITTELFIPPRFVKSCPIAVRFVKVLSLTSHV